VILVDANVLIYAVNADLPQHGPARRWLEKALSGTETIGLPWVVILAFLRLTTSPRVFERPLAVQAALGYVEEWLAQPPATTVEPGPEHWPTFRRLVSDSGTGGNLTTDAHLAALALERGAALCTTDRDFARFPGLRLIHPAEPR